MTDPAFLQRADGHIIAYRQISGRGPGILWLGGFRSDMTGTKAEALAEFAAREGRAFTRFDYFAHGQSSGRFEEATITRWRDDALAVLDELTAGPVVLVGSSMGGWMTMLLAHARPERVAAMVLIAPAPDLTEALMWSQMPPEVQALIMDQGRWDYPQGGYPITRGLIESGRENLVLNRPLPACLPVRILHGDADKDVPWQHGVKLMQVLSGEATFTLIKGADHRLSEPSHLRLIEKTLSDLLKDLPPC